VQVLCAALTHRHRHAGAPTPCQVSIIASVPVSAAVAGSRAAVASNAHEQALAMYSADASRFTGFFELQYQPAPESRQSLPAPARGLDVQGRCPRRLTVDASTGVCGALATARLARRAASTVVSSGACMPEAQLSCSQPSRRRRRGGGESSRRRQTRVSSRDDAASTGASAMPSSCWAARCAVAPVPVRAESCQPTPAGAHPYAKADSPLPPARCSQIADARSMTSCHDLASISPYFQTVFCAIRLPAPSAPECRRAPCQERRTSLHPRPSAALSDPPNPPTTCPMPPAVRR